MIYFCPMVKSWWQVTKPGEEPQMGPGPWVPGHGKTLHPWVSHFQGYINYDNSPTYQPHSVASETQSFLDRRGSTITHLQWGYGMGCLAEVLSLGSQFLVPLATWRAPQRRWFGES